MTFALDLYLHCDWIIHIFGGLNKVYECMNVSNHSLLNRTCQTGDHKQENKSKHFIANCWVYSKEFWLY